ncbi:MAG: spore coat assembly protein [Firmicutes bacterium]|nr:spore coat assembly protein [Bacillota bacterium]
MINSRNISILFVLILITVGLSNPVAAAELDYSGLFPKDQVIDVKIEIDEELLSDIYQNPIEEEYKPANVIYNGQQVKVVGIRTKGNSSLNSVAGSDSTRYSFKLKFNEYVMGQNLSGLTTINLNNNFSDPSYLREYLSYQIMEEMGVPTPEYSFVNLYINDELKGLYLAVQQVDEAFIKGNFEITDGDLYKPDGEGSDLLWKGSDISNYSGMNYKSDKNTDHQPLLNMLDELNNGKDYKKYLNVDEILRYFAVSTVLVNMDSYQGRMTHNYYLYEEDGVFSIIPWDFNMSFAGFSMGSSLEGMTNLKIDEPTSGPISEKPLIDKLLQVPEYKEKYHQYIEEIVTTHLDSDKFEKELSELAEFIRPYVEADPSKFYSIEEFDQSFEYIPSSDSGDSLMINASLQKDQVSSNMEVSKQDKDSALDGMSQAQDKSRNMGGGMKAQIGLFTFVKERVANIKQQLSGEIPSSGDGSGSGMSSGGRGMSKDSAGESGSRNGKQMGAGQSFSETSGNMTDEFDAGQLPANISDEMRNAFESGEIPANLPENMPEGFNPAQFSGRNNGQRPGRGFSQGSSAVINPVNILSIVVMLIIMFIISILFIKQKI